MTEDKQRPRRGKRRLWQALIVVAIILAALIAPPMISISHYKSQITRLISASLGRPVHLASVNVRLLPLPGFVLSDLSVEEDPQYGAEPILHANEVVARIRLFPLWRGRLEIGSIAVDEASLNIVRARPGEWNLDSLFRSAAVGSGQRQAFRLPYIAATHSRINFKNGLEKLPFSLIDTEFTVNERLNGLWTFSLRGQPARTDVILDQADTGVVRIEGAAQDAPELRKMPLRLNVVWKKAQFGQLSRLLFGSDSGWRGDLAGEAQVDGTAESAFVRARLRAESVHRSEFTPVAPLDFDARCSLSFHLLNRTFEKLGCDSPLGGGQIRLAGQHPAGAPLQLSFALDKLPAQAVLDALRTVRNGFGVGLEAKGFVSGQIELVKENPALSAQEGSRPATSQLVKTPSALPVKLTGGFTVDGLKLTGGGLGSPVAIDKILLAPAPVSPGQPQSLVASAAIPAGASAPLNLTAHISKVGYSIALHGSASPARIREFAHVGGLTAADSMSGVNGGQLSLDLTAEGPWIPEPTGLVFGLDAQANPNSADRLSGLVSLHNVNWTAPYLVNPVAVSSATLHLSPAGLSWDPVEFSYGPLKGKAKIDLPRVCENAAPCAPVFRVDFAELNASTVQAAFLGAREKGAVLAELIKRIRPAKAPAWPQAQGELHALNFVVGPAAMKNLSLKLLLHADKAEIVSFDAALLGGSAHGSGELRAPQNEREKPAYALHAELKGLSAVAVGQMLGARFAGGPIEGAGDLALTGYTGDDLAASAKGSWRFAWKRGAIAGLPSVPKELNRFAQWSGQAEIASGRLTIHNSQLGAANSKAALAVTLQARPKLSFAEAAAKP